jgi:hypothetical protein
VKRILIEDGLATILTICFMPFSVFRQCRDPDYAAWPSMPRIALVRLLNAKPREIKSFLSGHLAPGRTQELQTELLAAGIPL